MVFRGCCLICVTGGLWGGKNKDKKGVGEAGRQLCITGDWYALRLA